MTKQELIDNAVEALKGKALHEDDENVFVTPYDDFVTLKGGYKPSLGGWLVCRVSELNKRAKELGWINGYKYGVEYPTNGKKPNLPDDVFIEAKSQWYQWSNRFRLGDIAFKGRLNSSLAFRVVDERFKPKVETVSEFFEKNEPTVYGKPKTDQPDNSWKRGAKVEFPTGFGVLIVPEQDVNGVVIVMDESGEYKRVSASAIKPLKSEREKFIDAAMTADLSISRGQAIALYDAGFRAPEDK